MKFCQILNNPKTNNNWKIGHCPMSDLCLSKGGLFFMPVHIACIFHLITFGLFLCDSKFIHMKYHLDKKVSAYIAGAVYDVSMVLSPFLGGIIVSTIPKERELFRKEM